jgi:hypothetical protein
VGYIGTSVEGKYMLEKQGVSCFLNSSVYWFISDVSYNASFVHKVLRLSM